MKGLTSKALGELIGITGAGIINYENGNAYPSRTVLLKLKEQLGDEVLCDDYSKFITMNYKNVLKNWRRSNNLTCKNAAQYFDMAESTYHNFENMYYIMTKKHFEIYKRKISKIIKGAV